MAFSIFWEKKEDIFLVFDIGNASVGGALVERKNDNGQSSLNIVVSKRVDIPFGEDVLFERLLQNMASAVSAVAEPFFRKAGKHASIRVILASPWYSSETKVINIKKSKPFIFTKALQDELIGKEIADYKKLLRKGISDGREGAVSVIESEVISVRLNDYDTITPIGKEAYDASLALYLSIGDKKVLKTVTNKLRSFSPHADIIYHSFPLAYFTVVRDLYPKKHDFLLMDVSGEITDVSLVRHGVLLETSSFPLGRNFLLRRIAAGLKKTIPEALSLVSLFQKNGLHHGEAEKFVAILSKTQGEWLDLFQKALADLSGELYVPGEIFLAVDDDVESLFSEYISSEQFSQYSLSHEKFRVISLSHKHPVGIAEKNEVKCDQFLNIAMLFAQKLIEVGR